MADSGLEPAEGSGLPGADGGVEVSGTTGVSLQAPADLADFSAQDGCLVPSGDSKYLFYLEPTSHQSAVEQCEQRDGVLASVRSGEENEFLASVGRQLDIDWWLGGRFPGAGSSWNWQNGDEFWHRYEGTSGYANRLPEEPEASMGDD